MDFLGLYLIIYILFGNQIFNTAKDNLETTLKNRNEREFSGDIDVLKPNLRVSWEIMKVEILMKFRLKLNIHFNN